ncbi:GGDEF domain-containing protein [Chitiniphilus eburneus]|nr:GGDEF domain-containing protein [Chitiniphilus eburneus]
MQTKLTLNQKFWISSILVIAVSCTLAGQWARSNYQAYQLAQRSLKHLTLYQTVLLTTTGISTERGLMLAQMSQSQPSDHLQQALHAQRRYNDQRFDRLNRLLSQSGLANDPLIQDRLKQSRRALGAARAEADRLFSQPRAARPKQRITDSLRQMIAIVDGMRTVIDDIGTRAIESNTRITRVVVTTRTITQLREYAGRSLALLAPPMMEGKCLTGEQQGQSEQLLGRVNELQDLLESQLPTYMNEGLVRKARADANRRYFSDVYATLVEARLQCMLNAPSPMYHASEFILQTQPKLQSLERLRDAVFQIAIEGLRTSREVTRRQIMLTTAMTIAIGLALLGQVLLTRRTLIAPLLRARNDIIALAEGNTGCNTATYPSGVEMRELFRAIDILRSSQQRRNILEREREILTTQLQQQAETDGLTGLINRRGLDSQCQHLFARNAVLGRAVGLIMFDIDHFKQVNDEHGHLVGDRVLQAVAHIVRRVCRGNDIVGRFGGEEFVILVEGLDAPALRHLAEKVRRAIAGMSITLENGQPLTVSASFGVALSRIHPQSTWPQLIEMADTALYLAKNAGRDRVMMAPPAD